MGLDDIKEKFNLTHEQIVELVELLSGCVGFNSQPIIKALDEIDSGYGIY